MKKKIAAAEAAEKAALAQKEEFEVATAALNVEREELKQSFVDEAETLVEIFTDTHLDALVPRASNGSWKAPPTIVSKVRKLGSLMGVALKVLEVIAAKMAEIRARLEAVVERERQLDQSIEELVLVRDRLNAEDAQTVDRAQALVRSAEDYTSMDDPSPW